MEGRTDAVSRCITTKISFPCESYIKQYILIAQSERGASREGYRGIKKYVKALLYTIIKDIVCSAYMNILLGWCDVKKFKLYVKASNCLNVSNDKCNSVDCCLVGIHQFCRWKTNGCKHDEVFWQVHGNLVAQCSWQDLSFSSDGGRLRLFLPVKYVCNVNAQGRLINTCE